MIILVCHVAKTAKDTSRRGILPHTILETLGPSHPYCGLSTSKLFGGKGGNLSGLLAVNSTTMPTKYVPIKHTTATPIIEG
jgi:hypothetical protein